MNAEKPERLLDHRNQRLFRGFPGLEEAGKIAALPELRRPQVQRAQAGIESPLSIFMAKPFLAGLDGNAPPATGGAT